MKTIRAILYTDPLRQAVRFLWNDYEARLLTLYILIVVMYANLGWLKP